MASLNTKEDRIIRLEKLLADFKRALYGAKSKERPIRSVSPHWEDIEQPWPLSMHRG
jgi:hypothetical protein